MSDASPSLGPALERLTAAGLNLHGVLAPGVFDALVPPAWRCAALRPGARSVVVVGAGGRALFARFRASPEASLERDPLDAFTRRALEAAVAALAGRARAVSYAERRGGVYADFVALGRACGLGAPSRLGLLIHPRFGPWMSIRALLLCDVAVAPTQPLADFAPCRGCPAPCAAACRGGACAPDGFDASACAATVRRDPACRTRCDARRACIVAPEHAYTEDAQSHHAAAAATALRIHGA